MKFLRFPFLGISPERSKLFVDIFFVYLFFFYYYVHNLPSVCPKIVLGFVVKLFEINVLSQMLTQHFVCKWMILHLC